MNLRTLWIASLSLTLPASSVLLAEDPKPKSPFALADKNADGKLVETEFVEAVKPKLSLEAAKKRFVELDKNKDKSLSLEEFTAMATEAANKPAANAGNKPAAQAAGQAPSGEPKPKRKPKDDSRR
ncbi:MAG: EF-hand domain-containing protein [Opitutaceae bacterium]